MKNGGTVERKLEKQCLPSISDSYGSDYHNFKYTISMGINTKMLITEALILIISMLLISVIAGAISAIIILCAILLFIYLPRVLK